MLLILALASSAQSDSIGNCSTRSTDRFTFLDMAKVPFCFKFNGASTGSEPYSYFFYFGTQVDQYSLIQLDDSNLGDLTGDIWREDQDVEVQIEAGGVSSSSIFARKWDGNELWVFTQLSAVIVVEEGIITEVVWDEGCFGCDDANCIDGNCAIAGTTCDAEGGCDFSAYVSWYGTDTNDRYLLSAGQRLSQFSSASASAYYDYVKSSLDSDFVNWG